MKYKSLLKLIVSGDARERRVEAVLSLCINNGRGFLSQEGETEMLKAAKRDLEISYTQPGTDEVVSIPKVELDENSGITNRFKGR